MHWFWRVTIAIAVTSVYGAVSFDGALYAFHSWIFRTVQGAAEVALPFPTRYSLRIGWSATWVLPYCVLAFAVFGLLTRRFGPRACRVAGSADASSPDRGDDPQPPSEVPPPAGREDDDAQRG